MGSSSRNTTNNYGGCCNCIPIALGVRAHNRHEHHIQDQKQQAHFITQGEGQLQSVDNLLKQPNLPKPMELDLFRRKSVLEANQTALYTKDLYILGAFKKISLFRVMSGFAGLAYTN